MFGNLAVFCSVIWLTFVRQFGRILFCGLAGKFKQSSQGIVMLPDNNKTKNIC